MCKIRRFVDKRLSGNSTAARWGIFATTFSIGWAFLAFAHSFYATDSGGGMMLAAWIFGVVGIGLLVFATVVGIYWFTHPLIDTTPERLGNIESSLKDLIQEIRRDRNEWKKSQ